MKTTIAKLIVVAALSFSGTALAAEQMKSEEANTPASKPAASPAAPAVAPKLLSASQEPKPAKARPARSKSLDLRHCLDLKTNAAIAKCARE